MTEQTTKRVRKEYKPLDMDDLATFAVVDSNEERAKLAPKTAPGIKPQERSDTLKKMDEDNKDLYAAWVKAGKPKDFTKSPLGKVAIAPEKEETLRFLLRKSALFINCGLQFGASGVKLRDGRVVVSWRIIDKRERKARNGS